MSDSRGPGQENQPPWEQGPPSPGQPGAHSESGHQPQGQPPPQRPQGQAEPPPPRIRYAGDQGQPARPVSEPFAGRPMRSRSPMSRAKRTVITMVSLAAATMIVTAVVTAVVTLAVTGELTTRTLETKAVQSEVLNALRHDFGLVDVESVSCPPEQEVVPGRKFECDFKYAGKQQHIPIEVLNESGQYRIGSPRE